MAETRRLRVCLVTTWDIACGIAEHSRMLKQAVEAADPEIQIVPEPTWLDSHEFPKYDVLHYAANRWSYSDIEFQKYDVLHLNYQAALHSSWSAEAVAAWHGVAPVLVTYHDTGVPNSEQCKAVIAAADAAVVHEPFDDLPAEKTHYWRMGVEEDTSPRLAPPPPWQDLRPTLGTVGFPFPWKCYDELARVTARVGWGLRLLAPTATEEQRHQWRQLNPHTEVISEFLHARDVRAHLRECDATAFTYVTHNTGQSGPILLGIAAGKPVIALSTCRQMRALFADPLGNIAINWCDTFEQVADVLGSLGLGRFDTSIIALREQESWRHLGKQYAALYRQLAESRP